MLYNSKGVSIMQEKVFSKPKLVMFSVIMVLLSLLCLEFFARIVLSLNKDSLDYLLYGFKTIAEPPRLQKYEGKNGEAEYYKSTPMLDKKNPVNSRDSGTENREKKSGLKELCVSVVLPRLAMALITLILIRTIAGDA